MTITARSPLYSALRTILLLVGLLLLSTIPASAETSDDAATKELFDAVQAEDVAAIEAALAKGADINARSPRGLQSPLMSSVLNGREKAVKFLLEKGADVTIAEKDGYTPMHGAGFQGRTTIAKILFDHGVGLRDKHADGHEPAIRSCWGPDQRHTDTVKFFLEAGVPVDDIYDTCIGSTRSQATRELLQEWKQKNGGEL